jgi:Protein of unknown function (DUF1559)
MNMSHLCKRAYAAWCRWLCVAAVMLGAVVLPRLAGQDRLPAQVKPPVSPKTNLPVELQRVPADAALLVSVRVAELWNSEPVKAMRQQRAQELAEGIKLFEKEIGVSPEEIERATVLMNDFHSMRSVVFVTTGKPHDRVKILSTALAGARAEKRGEQIYFVSDEKQAVYFLNDQSYLIGPAETIRVYVDRPPAGKGPLTPVLELAGQRHQIVGGLAVPPLGAGAGGQLPPQLEAFKDLLKARTAIWTVDLGEQSKADLRLNFADDADAKRAEAPLRAAIDLARVALATARQEPARQPAGDAGFADMLKLADAALQSASVTQKGADLEIALGIKAAGPSVVATLVGGVQRVRRAANRAQTSNNLKQIALAMHNYHDAYGHLPPPAIYSKDGKPLLSWRVALLPFLEGDNLYKQFNLDEAWDSPHNHKLLAQMPKLFADPNVETTEPATVYQAFVGPGAFFEGAKELKFVADFPDGMSNTLMIVEAAKPVPWTKPEDLLYDPAKPLPQVGGHTPGGFSATFCDGSVHVLRQNIKESVLRALITRNGGEVIDPNEF